MEALKENKKKGFYFIPVKSGLQIILGLTQVNIQIQQRVHKPTRMQSSVSIIAVDRARKKKLDL